MSSLFSSLSEHRKKFGSSTIFILIIVYFGQGFRSFGSAAQILYFKNIFHLDPADFTIVSSLSYLGWYMKPIYGLISDTFPLLGYHRKTYIFFCGIFGTLAYLALLSLNSFSFSIACLIIGEYSQAIADVICDGLMVEKARSDSGKGANILQRYSWGSLFFGIIVGNVLGGNAADYFDPKVLLACMAICPFLISVSALFVEEEKTKMNFSIRFGCTTFWENLKIFYESIKDSKIYRFLFFIFLWQASFITFSSIFVYFLYDILLLSPSTISYFSLISSIGAFFAMFLGPNFMKNIGIHEKLAIGRIISSLLTIFDIIVLKKLYENIGLPVYLFLFNSFFATEGVDMLFTRIPTMVIAAQISPTHIEATFYSFFSSVNNIGMSVSELLASLIMKISGINDPNNSKNWVLSLLSIFLGFLSLVLLCFLPSNIQEIGLETSIKEDNAHQLELQKMKKEIERPLLDNQK